jgi:beta-mannosidase
MHSWSVWSGGAPYTSYGQEHPRFLSEFGFQSMPDLRTVRAEAGDDEDLESPALQNHERFIHGYDRMNQYLTENFRPVRDFASFVYLSQVMQSEAIKFGVETMRSRRPETMGTLYWQLDDCWPVASWSSIDYFGRWKALQYYAARFYAPLLVVASTEGQTLNVHIVSDELTQRDVLMRMRMMHFDGTSIEEHSTQVQVLPLTSNAIPPITLSDFDPRNSFAVLTLEQHGEVLASNTVYFARPLELALPQPRIAAKIRTEPRRVSCRTVFRCSRSFRPTRLRRARRQAGRQLLRAAAQPIQDSACEELSPVYGDQSRFAAALHRRRDPVDLKTRHAHLHDHRHLTLRRRCDRADCLFQQANTGANRHTN